MPVYEYKCKKCGENFELRLGLFQRKSSTKCPKCGDTGAERVYSGFSTGTSRGESCSPRKFS